jgi:hypothetical protein
MTTNSLDPGHLTESQVDDITAFARAHPPVKARLELIQKSFHPDDVNELTRQLRFLVKDSARKLYTSNLLRMGERTEGVDVQESNSK